MANLDPTLLINRELSWLEFNQRVLDEAEDESVPLLERVKFLSIVASNLDEFFMIRVAGLKQQLGSNLDETTADGLSPQEQLTRIAARVHAMVAAKYALYRDRVRPALRNAGIILGGSSAWTQATAARAEAYFIRDVFPVLTPLVIDPGHPFPRLKNKSLNLGVVFESSTHEDGVGFAVVQVPAILPRLVDTTAGDDGLRTWMFLEDIIRRYVGKLFPGTTISSVSPFRMTRNWDLEIDEEEAEDLLATIQAELRRRERGSAVRLEVAARTDQRFLALLRKVLQIEDDDVYAVDGPLNLGDLMSVVGSEDRRDLKDEVFAPQVVPPFRDVEDYFALVAERDVLLHHPYESYDSVVEFVARAAEDPRVLAIKITLYRAGSNSPFVRALARAAELGKQVTALVELKARFDEENNIQWARALEESGVHVVYGVIGLKTHAKACLIVRRETAGLRRYVHLATGNYNPSSARLYTDLSLFTARAEVGEDITDFFNLLTGYCTPPEWRVLAVAPMSLRAKVIELIEAEAEHARAGRSARVVAKLNSLIDPEVIAALYAASQAGVRVDLIVRGICGLRPGLPGVSENIRVISVVDRFLEHSRILSVDNGGDPAVYLSSADWMPRNFDRRVELLFPVLSPALAQWVRESVLAPMFADNVKSHEMRGDGTYARRAPAEGEAPMRCQSRFMEIARSRARMSVLAPPQGPFRASAATVPPPSDDAAPPLPDPPRPKARARRKPARK
ncbi:MAG: polyphosphate kinase 1 [Polyangiales bacterium]